MTACVLGRSAWVAYAAKSGGVPVLGTERGVVEMWDLLGGRLLEVLPLEALAVPLAGAPEDGR